MRFFIGWHQPVGGKSGCGEFENTMISVNRLIKRRSHFPVQNWILDSGAFTRITSGKGHLSSRRYAAEVKRWADCGNLEAAVSQDYLCDPFVLSKTGLTVADHQRLTILRYDNLLQLIGPNPYLMPVLQGFTAAEFCDHIDQYGERLQVGMWVGVGSICKRSSSPSQIENVLLAIHAKRPDLKLHGFGVKKAALKSGIVWDLLHSADSQAAIHLKGKGSIKYVGGNDPSTALNYAKGIYEAPRQISIWSI